MITGLPLARELSSSRRIFDTNLKEVNLCQKGLMIILYLNKHKGLCYYLAK